MVRAVLRDGVIYPIEPLPPDWQDGRELGIEDLPEGRPPSGDVESWARELDRLATEIDPQDAETIDAAVAEVRRRDRELARRQAGLP